MKNSSILKAFLGGAALGAIAGILFAPESGTETRKRLAEKGSDLVDRVKKVLDERGVKINEEDLEEISEELKDELI